jgi:predicted Zn-dependent protease
VFPLLFLAAGLALAQQPQNPPPPQHAEPEEEDAIEKPREYTFNPIQAANEIRIGRFYVKRGKPKAAAMRFEEATKWNPGSAEAWQLLGEAREKLHDTDGARAAYEKSLQIKSSGDVRKRLAALGKH